MGLEKRENHTIYVKTFNGEFTVKSNAQDKEAKKRELEDGKSIYERTYNELSGFLYDVHLKDGKFGFEWHFDIEDNGTMYKLQISKESPIARMILYRIPNLDFKRKFQIFIKRFPNGNDGLWLLQDEKKVERYFDPPNNPNGLPAMEKVQFKGKERWDDTKMFRFLALFVKENIKPKLPGSDLNTHEPDQADQFEAPPDQSNAIHTETDFQESSDSPFNNNASDDLPF